MKNNSWLIKNYLIQLKRTEGGVLIMFIDNKDRELSRVVYALIDEDKKVAYIGQTTKKLRIRVNFLL